MLSRRSPHRPAARRRACRLLCRARACRRQDHHDRHQPAPDRRRRARRRADQGRRLDGVGRGEGQGRRRRLQGRDPGARRRHRDRRPVRPGAGRDQCPQDGLRQHRRRRHRSADERLGQGDVADPEPGRPGDHHAELDQPRHHQSEIRQPIPAGRQGGLFPHGDDRRLSRARTWRIITPIRSR